MFVMAGRAVASPHTPIASPLHPSLPSAHRSPLPPAQATRLSLQNARHLIDSSCSITLGAIHGGVNFGCMCRPARCVD